MGSGSNHALYHIACLWHACRDRGWLRRGNGNTYADRVYVRIFRRPLICINNDKPSQIAEPFHTAYSIYPLERRYHHAVFEGELFFPLVYNLDCHFPLLNLFYLCIGMPVYMPFAEFVFKDALGITYTAQPQMADIRLRCDKGYWDFFSYLSPSEVGIENKGKFIRRPEARRQLSSAHHNRPRLF